MLIPKVLDNKAKFVIAVAFAAWLTLVACKVSVKDHEQGQASKVDIETPIGGIHVDENADARDAGLPVYPGAKLKQKSNDGEEKSANVDISGFGFGLKVVALEYESDDPSDKIVAYYQDQLKKYGNVLQCRTHALHVGKYKAQAYSKDNSKKLTCDDDNSGNTIELKAGTEDNEHIVSIEPQAKGSDFAIVWVRIRGQEGEI
jgi:hypothetical protein